MNARKCQSDTLWRVHLFDGPVLTDAAGNEVRRFRSRRVGTLLAYLTLHLGRPCPREELYEAIWPEEEIGVVSNRLRVALASLRRQLEPAGVPFGAVIDVGTPGQIRLRSETVWCDVAAFEAALRAGRRTDAAQLARGTLLPGYYDEWVIAARERYEALREGLPPPEYQAAIAAPPQPAERHETAVQRLPLYLTRFFGREADRERLHALLKANRLVTVTGPGGVGKTRLAVETVREASFPAVFVPLADLPAADHVPAAILRALLIALQQHADPEEQLVAALQNRDSILLILDNAEHLAVPVASLALRLLEALPNLRLLVTGRRSLDVYGEALFTLKPLETPPHTMAPEQLLEFPAVALFLDRARALLPDFAFSPRHGDALVEICLRLQGMPLALELAAARITSQTPNQVAEALRRDATNLKSRQRGLAERHRSLRTVIETSLQLLPDEVRTFFFSFVRFKGDWTIAKARTLTGCPRTAEYLELLVASSLADRYEDERLGAIRFTINETIRQFVLHNYADEIPPSEWELPGNLIVNGSFEVDRPNDTWLNVGGALFPYPLITPFGWKGTGSVNVNVPDAAAFPAGVPDGSNVAAVGDHNIGSGRLYQEVPAVLTAGMTYILSVKTGNRIGYHGSGRILLETVSGHLLADSGIVTPAVGTFTPVTLVYTAHYDMPGLGEGIRVALERADGLQASFDCICLTVSPSVADNDADRSAS